jgi:Family of unknown function (DUF6518)
VRLLGLTVAAGVLVGTVGWASDEGPRVVDWAGAIAAGWLIGAFVVGAVAGGGLRAALAGAGTLVVGVSTYYALFHPMRPALLVVIVGWAAFGAVVGAVFGWAGDAWRRRRAQAVGVALLAGALAGEAILLLGQWEEPAARAVLIGELAAGAALPFLLARRQLVKAVPLTAAVAVAVLATEQTVREAMRAAGWTGA